MCVQFFISIRHLAPVKIGVLPLSKKLNEGCRESIMQSFLRNITANLMTEETLVRDTAVRMRSEHHSA